jgi:hypothetical protein
MTQSIVRYLLALVLGYAVHAGIVKTSDADTLTADITQAIALLISAAGLISWSALEKQAKGVLDKYVSTPPKTVAILIGLVGVSVGLTGCAGLTPAEVQADTQAAAPLVDEALVATHNSGDVELVNAGLAAATAASVARLSNAKTAATGTASK